MVFEKAEEFIDDSKQKLKITCRSDRNAREQAGLEHHQKDAADTVYG
jgi:hypothetical protein